MTTGQTTQPDKKRPLRLKARSELVVRALQFSGVRYYSIKDPLALRYYQLREEEYWILTQLDGEKSLAEIQSRFETEFAPRKLNAEQLHGFLGTLHQNGLVIADAPGQGEILVTRAAETRRKALVAKLTNMLAIRFRGIDPEPLLAWMYPKCRWLFSAWSVAGYLLLTVAAGTLLGVEYETLLQKLPGFHAFFNATNAVWIAAALIFAKVLHEFGHGLACKHFGGECHELGFMLLAFTPCMYCNVSDAWLLENKWHRVAISAAGICVELVLAAICTFLWWTSQPGLLNTLCLNTMFVCSVSTVVFNGNPLLRYDGYYVLADIVEVPNLQQQSTALVRNFLAKFFWGAELVGNRMLPERKRGFLVGYAIASTVYRWLVVIGILWFVHEVLKPYRLEIVARFVAVFALTGMLAPTVSEMVRVLRDPRRSRQVKWGRFVVRGGITAVVITILLTIRLPHRIGTPVVVEPQGAQRVYVSLPGTLTEAILAGQEVRAGDSLAVLQNRDVEMEIAKLRGQRNLQQMRLMTLERRRVSDPTAGAQLPTAREALADLEERFARRMRDQQRLTLTAPVSGTVMSPHAREHRDIPSQLPTWSETPLEKQNLGSFLETGTLYCLVGDPGRLEAVLVIDQSDIEFVNTGQRVRITLDELPGKILTGRIMEIAQRNLKVAPRELQSQKGLPTRVDESGIERPLHATYQARVEFDSFDKPLLMGTSGQARILVGSQSIASRISRYFHRTFRLDL